MQIYILFLISYYTPLFHALEKYIKRSKLFFLNKVHVYIKTVEPEYIDLKNTYPIK